MKNKIINFLDKPMNRGLLLIPQLIGLFTTIIILYILNINEFKPNILLISTYIFFSISLILSSILIVWSDMIRDN